MCESVDGGICRRETCLLWLLILIGHTPPRPPPNPYALGELGACKDRRVSKFAAQPGALGRHWRDAVSPGSHRGVFMSWLYWGETVDN